jgi:1-acyl-sn-glycerol-3-phosphate acyltransferase
MKTAMSGKSRTTLPRVSTAVMRLFAAYNRNYLRRNFHSLRISKIGVPPRNISHPIVIYLNHASWWDPLVCLLLSREFFRNHTSFAPIEAKMLERYRFFKHLGFFGVERSAIGAKKFLRTTRAITASSRRALWITPQGRFMDVRERPLELQRGLGALAAQSKNIMFLPLAIEYAFWTERRPEILASFGKPIISGDKAVHSATEWTGRFSDVLQETQDELASRSCRRDPGEWLVLNRGAPEVNSIYDMWCWLRARIQRQELISEHYAEELL